MSLQKIQFGFYDDSGLRGRERILIFYSFETSDRLTHSGILHYHTEEGRFLGPCHDTELTSEWLGSVVDQVRPGLILIGAVASGLLGDLAVKASGRLLGRIPVVGSIYSWTRQIFETVLSEESTAFREVVLIEYPSRGSWAIGFITGQTEGEVQSLTSETVYNVFVPATPNPTTGFLLFIPERDIRRLEVSVDEGLKLVVSGGLVKPAADQAGDSVFGEPTGIAREVEAIKQRMAAEMPEPPRPADPFGRLRDYLFTGTLVAAPVAITVWLTLAVITAIDDSVIPYIPSGWNPATYLPFGLPGLGLVVAVLLVTLIGFLAAGFLGNLLLRASERMIKRLPLIRGIYSAVKQIFETLLKNQSEAFREVVLVQYPRPEAWAIGFLTGGATSSVQDQTPGDSVNVFLPTTPNPTSGFLIFVPQSEAARLSMTVEEGLKMVVSGGIVTPGGGEDGRDDLSRTVAPDQAGG